MEFYPGKCYAVSRETGLKLLDKPRYFCVDTYKDGPKEMKAFEYFNPFYFSTEFKIPVPGQKGTYAHSIESIWQGLKVVDGDTSFEMFTQPPFKRPSDDERRKSKSYIYKNSSFLYEGSVIDILKARFFIYLTSYCYLLNKVVPNTLLDKIKDAKEANYRVIFYDWDSNFDILNTQSSFSHSAILSSWFNETLYQEFLLKGYKYYPELQKVIKVESLNKYLLCK